MKKICTALALSAAAVTGAHAAEVYTGIGTHGLMLGFAQPVSDSITVRVDVASLGTHTGAESESGIDYEGTARLHRTGVFADWFFAGGWRVTLGATFNKWQLDLVARGNGGTINIGGTDYTSTPDDRLDVHHAWLVEDLDGGRVRILTQETQKGQPAAALHAAKPNPMINGHQDWLDGLVAAARAAKEAK